MNMLNIKGFKIPIASLIIPPHFQLTHHQSLSVPILLEHLPEVTTTHQTPQPAAMQILQIIALVSLLGVTNAKINQYLSEDDCHADRNNQKHTEDVRTTVAKDVKIVFTNELLNPYSTSDCSGKALGSFPRNKCNPVETLFDKPVKCVRPTKDKRRRRGADVVEVEEPTDV
ncbi:hypothetical protein F5B20DRAFT_393647 [Whalleya microplaca]|nr:hypothetical protein F5B20DRAFT_393647 [Whalleya microplaca]